MVPLVPPHMACSIESKPARRAASMPSLACACAVTLRPSACDVLGNRVQLFLGELLGRCRSRFRSNTPPVAVTLITSAPRLTICRTALRQSSGPSQVPRAGKSKQNLGPITVYVAVAAAGRDCLAGCQDARAGNQPVAHGVAQGEDGVTAGAEVAHGSEAGFQGPARELRPLQCEVRIRPLDKLALAVAAGLGEQVHMQVDKAWHHESVAGDRAPVTARHHPPKPARSSRPRSLPPGRCARPRSAGWPGLRRARPAAFRRGSAYSRETDDSQGGGCSRRRMRERQATESTRRTGGVGC